MLLLGSASDPLTRPTPLTDTSGPTGQAVHTRGERDHHKTRGTRDEDIFRKGSSPDAVQSGAGDSRGGLTDWLPGSRAGKNGSVVTALRPDVCEAHPNPSFLAVVAVVVLVWTGLY
ncbi:hypothetical protein WMY93_010994 [Mugilogobius chulae]|uniref:Uncharacterized protein n=1 Tax=Mugilogobius chulae TaxID=88201 RepID=A0AAW0P8V2_9GOBI